jgi:hypothetical protein
MGNSGEEFIPPLQDLLPRLDAGGGYFIILVTVLPTRWDLFRSIRYYSKAAKRKDSL